MSIKDTYTHIVAAMPNCKVRDSQLQMVKEINDCCKAINPLIKDGHNLCLIEAPTGTGKSLAYLIAGIENAKHLGKKLVISTATKTLQSQLVEKDIPMFMQYSGLKFNYGLAKGRSNYLCPYQLQLSLGNREGDLFADSGTTIEQLQTIYQSFNKGWNGDLDLAPLPISQKLKALITTDKDRCLNYSCPYNQKDDSKCPFYLNRDKLKNYEVIVTNHSLLLADLVLGGGSVLPIKPNEYLLCVDEGHNFADIAINSFSQKFELKQTLSSCQNLAKLIYNPQTQSYFDTDIKVGDELFNRVTDLIEVLEQLLLLLMQNQHLFNDERLILNDYLNPTLGHDFRDYFVTLAYIAGQLYTSLSNFITKLKEQIKVKADSLMEANLNKLGFYTTVIERVFTTSQYIINQDDSRYNANAKWIERQIVGSNEEWLICAGLTHVGNILLNKLWAKVYGGIITSATLSIGNDFNYYKHKLGLNLYLQVKCIKLATTFSYPQQGQIVVPRFKVSPEYAKWNEFGRELTLYLATTLAYEEGYGTLVLFFNRVQLQEVYANLPKVIQKRILLQTEYISNQSLINQHKQQIESGQPSIIFGLNSFAEGIDLPSLYCMHVIITKLPFDMHKNPESMVQEYWIKFEKGNYFAEVSLPNACIRLIQAVGRLIRDEGDYGQVSICDNRLVTKSYGNSLLNALPNFNRKYNNAFIKEAFAKISARENY